MNILGPQEGSLFKSDGTEAKGHSCVENGGGSKEWEGVGGGRGMSSKAADSDRTAKKVILAPEPAATPPALPCARAAHSPAYPPSPTFAHALRSKPLFSPDYRGALTGGEAAQTGGLHRTALVAPEPERREQGAPRQAPTGAACRGRSWGGSGAVDLGRAGTEEGWRRSIPLRPLPPPALPRL